MPDQRMTEALLDIARAWLQFKMQKAEENRLTAIGLQVKAGSVTEFVGAVNRGSAQLMSAMGCADPDVLESMGELFINASTMVKNGEITQRQGW